MHAMGGWDEAKELRRAKLRCCKRCHLGVCMRDTDVTGMGFMGWQQGSLC